MGADRAGRGEVVLVNYTLPVQHCSLCRAPGVRVQVMRRWHSAARGLYDAQCSGCGNRYTSAAWRMVLRALTSRPVWGKFDSSESEVR